MGFGKLFRREEKKHPEQPGGRSAILKQLSREEIDRYVSSWMGRTDEPH